MNINFTVLLIAIAVLTGPVAGQTWTSAASGNWSAAATWTPPAGATTTTPPAGATVMISASTTVNLDQDYVQGAPLGPVTVDGVLNFTPPAAGATRSLAADRIFVTGRFIVGASPAAPFVGNAEIVLTGTGGTPQREFIVRPGAQLMMHGTDIANPWVQLDSSIAAGMNQTKVDLSVADWPIGSDIVFASTDYDMNEAEVHRLAAINGGQKITISGTFVNEHYGALSAAYGPNNRRVDMRGEVALLERNIVVRGAPAPVGSPGLGGHMMFMGTPTGSPPTPTSPAVAPTIHLDNVEFRNMGQTGNVGRYPIHFHFAGSVATSYVRKCVIRNSNFRAISVHGSHDLTVENNVAYDIVGHAYYLEDGSETGNVFERNLGLVTHATTPLMRPDPFDPAGGMISTEDDTPGTFWITNPDNTFNNNHAAGCDDAGFWFVYHDPAMFGGPGATVTDPLTLTLVNFSGNVAHSNARYGVFDDDFGWSGNGQFSTPNWPNTTVYKNGNHGFWVRAYGALRTPGLRAADNPSALYFASTAFFGNEQTTFILDGALIIGESANTGDSTLGSVRTPAPNPPPNGNLIGVEIYDGLIRLEDCDFAEFSSSPSRRAGAIGPNETDQAATVDPRTTLVDLRFHPSSAPTSCNPLWLRSSPFATWPAGNGSRGVILHARTASPGAWAAGETIVAANGEPNPNLAFLAHATGATYRADWNAHVIPSTWVSAPLASASTTGTHGQLMFGYAAGPVPSSFALSDVPSTVSRNVGVNNSIFFPANVVAGRVYDVVDGFSARSGVTLATWGFGAPYSFVVLRLPITAAPASIAIHWAQPSSDAAGLGTAIYPTNLTSYTDVSTSAQLSAWSLNDFDLVGHDMANNLLYLKMIMLDGSDPLWVPTHPITPNMPTYIHPLTGFPGEDDLYGFSQVTVITW